MSPVSVAFLENSIFIKRFLARFFSAPPDIEDVAQEAYLRAYAAEQNAQSEHIEHPKAFLFRIAKNIALTKLTEKSRQITDYIEETGVSAVLQCEASADEEIEAQQRFGIYCEAVALLPERCRQVFLLRKVHGLSHREIARRMSLSVSSVEKYLRQGILATRDLVDRRENAGLKARLPVPARENVSKVNR